MPLLVGFATALELCEKEREDEALRLRGLRDRMLEGLRRELDDVVLNGDAERRLPGNLNLSFAGVEADKLLLALPDLALSTGSACSSASPEPSHVLAALGVPERLARASLRIGLGRGTRVEDVDCALSRIVAEVRALRG